MKKASLNQLEVKVSYLHISSELDQVGRGLNVYCAHGAVKL